MGQKEERPIYVLSLPVRNTARTPTWELSSSSINSGKPYARIRLSRRGRWSVRITPGLRLRPEHLTVIDGMIAASEKCDVCQRVLAKAGRA